MQAGRDSDEATLSLGSNTLRAGELAFFGSAFATCGVLFGAWLTEWAKRRASKERHRAAFWAEISSVLAYLSSVSVVGELRIQANGGPRKHFHPGNAENWLRVYYAAPSSVGYFRSEVSGELVWFYARMFAQFGRLIYLHNLNDSEWRLVGDPAIRKIQTEIADTLDDLAKRGGILLNHLKRPSQAAATKEQSVPADTTAAM